MKFQVYAALIATVIAETRIEAFPDESGAADTWGSSDTVHVDVDYHGHHICA